MLIGKYNKSVIITYLGVVIALLGTYMAYKKNVQYALICLIIAGICDLFDGAFARTVKRTEDEKSFGVEIDSLADMIDFVMLPICIFYALGLDRWYHIAIFILYALAAIIRLGFFNISTNIANSMPIKYYSGLPLTYTALILPTTFSLSFILPMHIFQIIYTLIILLLTILFILNIKVVKPRGVFYIMFPIIAISMILILLFMGK